MCYPYYHITESNININLCHNKLFGINLQSCACIKLLYLVLFLLKNFIKLDMNMLHGSSSSTRYTILMMDLIFSKGIFLHNQFTNILLEKFKCQHNYPLCVIALTLSHMSSPHTR